MRLYIMIFAIVSLLGVGFAGYKIFTNMQEKIYTLTDENTKLNGAVETQKQAIKDLEEGMKRAQEETQRVNAEFAAIQQQNRVLSDKLAKFDLAVLGERKPGLVEKVINKATVKVGRCFELLSGSPLTDAEKASKTATEFNSECPWLWEKLVPQTESEKK